MKEEDLNILDTYNKVLDLPSKSDHHHASMSIPLIEKNKRNIQPNQVSTAIPQIVITPTEPDKTGQEIVLEKTTPTKTSEITFQTNEIKRNAISQEDIVLMEMNEMSQKTEDIKEIVLPKSSINRKVLLQKRKQQISVATPIW